MSCAIFRCTCSHEFQDRMYGKGNRVFNQRMAGSKENGYRCTICGRTVDNNGR